MKENNKKTIITVPFLNDPGGVASFYKAVLPHFTHSIVETLEIGGTRNAGGLLHPIVDQIRFRLAVQRKHPGLVHLNPSLGMKSFIRDGMFAWQAKRLGCSLLVFWRGWDKDFETVMEKKYLDFFRRTFGRANGFIVLASEFKQKLRSWGVTVPIYNGTTTVNENLLCGFDLAAKLDQIQQVATIKILFLARLEPAKGLFETVQAVRMLLDQNKQVSLTIAGEGKIRWEIETFCRNLNLSEKQVCFTGDIRGEYKVRAFAEHHIYCLPSYYGEGLPNSVLEAMAFGLPVVTRPVGGLADMFEDGKMGVLVQGKTPEEITNGLDRLISDRNNMVKIAKYNACYAQEHFMAPVVAKRLVEIYASMIGNS